ADRGEPQRRRAPRDDLDQRPVARLRRRELGLLDMTTSRHEAMAKAAVLIDALPWLERFSGKVVVIKFGGNAMTGAPLRASFAEDVVFLRYAGLRPVVVHGG